MQYSTFTLENGFRIVHRQVSNPVAHIALHIGVGSRDETENQQGIAHFIEHVIFKGTKKRKAYHILSRLEHVGGELNAFTSKEETCLYASLPGVFYERALELIADIAQNAVFPQHELEKEKTVVLDEIQSYLENPSDAIFDEFDSLVFAGHPLGNNILGKIETVNSFTRTDLLEYLNKNYSPHRMVLSSAGNISDKKVFAWAAKYFNLLTDKGFSLTRSKPQQVAPKNLTRTNGAYQTHIMLGCQSFELPNPKRYAMSLLNNMLGGPGMNCRLNLSLREKNGLCYQAESHYTPYSDTGIFSLYFATDNGKAEKALKIVEKEYRKMRTEKPGTLQLHRAIQQFCGQLAISFESNLNDVLATGKGLLSLNRIIKLDEVIQIIQRITADEILETANQLPEFQQLHQLTFIPGKHESEV